MKKIVNIILPCLLVLLAIGSCNKVKDLPHYPNGSAPTLAVSPSDITLSATGNEAGVMSFSWGDPKFATDTSNYKFLVELAPSGTNFSKFATFNAGSAKSWSITGSQLNNLLVSWGIKFDSAGTIDTRVVASYANNNDQQISNTVKVTARPYAVAFTLSSSSAGPFAPTIQTKDNVLATATWTKADYGSSLATYTIQSAKAGTNFASVNEIMVGSDVYKQDITALQLNTMAQSAGIDIGVSGKVDARIKSVINGTNQVSYSTPVTFTVTPQNMIVYLWVPGDYQGWSPGVAPFLASTDGINYQGFVDVPAGGTGQFKFTNAPDWDHTAYGGTGTTISPSGGNLVWPALGTHYMVSVNISTMTWSATEITTWGVIGDATPGGWDNSTPLTFDWTNKVWKGTIMMNGTGQFKFRANNGWDINLGGNATGLNFGGDNINTPGSGNKVITLDLKNSPKYTYTVQ
ncbi:MAG: SusE domain-containing protein [Ginsengibacter sp.]